MKKQDIFKGLLLCAFVATVATGCGLQQKSDADLEPMPQAQEEQQDISQGEVCPTQDLEEAQAPSEQEEIALEETAE